MADPGNRQSLMVAVFSSHGVEGQVSNCHLVSGKVMNLVTWAALYLVLPCPVPSVVELQDRLKQGEVVRPAYLGHL